VCSQSPARPGTPDSVRCARLVSGEMTALGIDDDVRLKFNGLSGGAPDCSVSQPSPVPTVGRAIFTRHVGCSNGQLVHRTVSGAPITRKEQRSALPDLEGNRAPDMLQWLSGGALDCPVRHSTEGKNSLPCWPPTAPSCHGAIKGTPGRMEESPKHSLSLLRLPHSASAQLIDCVSDLSSV
jgi:hypothetical protein